MKRPLRIGILAGEMSGDTLGAGLMAEIRLRYPDAVFEGIGGTLMSAQGLHSRAPMDRLSVMGLLEPLKRLPELLRIRRDLHAYFTANPPDVFVGIDSPDFCLGLEEKLRRRGITTVHYVSPTVWAWRQKRIKKIARAVDMMLTLFPFEARFYERQGIPHRFVGHPLADEFPEEADSAAARRHLSLPDDGFVLALLPGSRHSEVERLSRPFLQAADRARRHYGDVRVVVSAAGEERKRQLEAILREDFPRLEATLVSGRSRDVMVAADLLLLASGTVTLEALLLKRPMIVGYRMSSFSHAIISRLLKVPYISLPNLLARHELVPELIQSDVNPENLFEAIRQKRDNPRELIELKKQFQDIHQQLRHNASRQAANAILELICQKQED